MIFHIQNNEPKTNNNFYLYYISMLISANDIGWPILLDISNKDLYWMIQLYITP